MSGGSGKIRLKELAAALNLSVTTVSRALAGYADVSAETRERVRRMAEARGYVASRVGRMLVSGRTDFVGMMLPFTAAQIIDAFLGEFLIGLADSLAERGRDLFLAAVPRGKSDDATLRHLVDGAQVDGVVITRVTETDPRAHILIERGVPFVAHGRLLDAPRPYAWFDTDGEAAFGELAEMLIGLGHRRFALMAPSVPYTYAHFRRRGFEDALMRAGIALPDDHIVSVPPGDDDAAARAARRLLAMRPRPTAIVALIDPLALAVLSVARDLGIAVPADLTVVGFDNLPTAGYAALSTFDQRSRHSGHAVGEMIVERIEKGEAGIVTRLVRPQFVPRGSHGPAPDDPARPRR
jgi:LacI family transcriptional regulator